MKGNDDVKFFAVQTVFEGHSFNTRDKLRHNQLKYDLKIPMAHVEGDSDADRIPAIMRRYRTGGTPWTVIIDPSGQVVYNHFHVKAAQAVEMFEVLVAQRK